MLLLNLCDSVNRYKSIRIYVPVLSEKLIALVTYYYYIPSIPTIYIIILLTLFTCFQLTEHAYAHLNLDYTDITL